MSSDELKDTQTIMEEKVYRIWTVLSAFEGRKLHAHNFLFFTKCMCFRICCWLYIRYVTSCF